MLLRDAEKISVKHMREKEQEVTERRNQMEREEKGWEGGLEKDPCGVLRQCNEAGN